MANENFAAGWDASSPAVQHEAVTPHDSTNFTKGIARGLYIGTGGDAVVVTPDGTAVEYVALPTGSVLAVACIRVNNTNTDASDIVALY